MITQNLKKSILFPAVAGVFLCTLIAPVQALAAGRIVGASSNGVYLKESSPTDHWKALAESIPNGVTSPLTTATRIGFLQPGADPSDARLYIKDGPSNAGWTLVAEHVRSYSIAGDKIAVVTTDKKASIKSGDIKAGFKPLAENVESITLSPHRIGVVLRNSPTDGCTPFGGWCAPATFYVKEYTVSAPWKKVDTGFLRSCFTQCYDSELGIALTDERIATINAGAMKVKEGGLEAPWVSNFWNSEVYGSVKLGGDRICLTDTSNNCKEGSLTSGFIAYSISEYGTISDLSHNRVILDKYVVDHNELFIYEGRLGNGLSATKISDNLQQVVLEK